MRGGGGVGSGRRGGLGVGGKGTGRRECVFEFGRFRPTGMTLICSQVIVLTLPLLTSKWPNIDLTMSIYSRRPHGNGISKQQLT